MKLASNGEDVIEVLLTSKLVMRSSDKKKAQKNQKIEQTSDQKEDKSDAKKKENTTPKEKSIKVPTCNSIQVFFSIGIAYRSKRRTGLLRRNL